MNQLTKALYFSLFICLAFGQLTRLPWFGPSLNLYLHDLLIILLLILNLRKIPSLPLTKPIAIFFFASLLSLILAIPRLSRPELLISSLYLWRWFAYACLYFIARPNLNPNLLILTTSLIAVFGLTQYLFLPDTRFLQYSGWDDHYFRLISTLIDPAFTGIILVLGMIWLSLKMRQHRLFFPLFGLHLITLMFTYSRSSYLALFIASAVIAWGKKQLKYFLIFLCLILSLALILPRPAGEGVKLERTFSITQRLQNWQQGWQLIKQKPVFGFGFNTLRYHRQDFVSHAAAGLDSSLLFVWATTGIIGLLAYLYLLHSIWQHALVIKASLSAVFFHALFNHTLFYPWVMIWLWLLLASAHKPKSLS